MWTTWLALTLAAPDVGPCQPVRDWIAEQIPLVKRGRMEVTRCLREPGERVIVLLSAPGGALAALGGPEHPRVRAVVGGWTSERLVLLDADASTEVFARAVFAPLRVERVVPAPALGGVDVVLHPADAARADVAALGELLGLGGGVDVRVMDAAALEAARAQGRSDLTALLAGDDVAAAALVELGVRSVSDVVLSEPDLVRPVLGEATDAVIADAAWWCELGDLLSADVRQRGW